MILLIFVILILFGGLGGGYYGNSTYPGWGGPGFGLGAILIIVVIFYLIRGGFRF